MAKHLLRREVALVAVEAAVEFLVLRYLQSYHLLHTIEGSILRMLFCSGLGEPLTSLMSSLVFKGTFSSECLTLPEPPEGRPICSLPASEAMLLLTLDPGVGDEGLTAPLIAPFNVGICDIDPLGVPSADLMSREAGGSALGLGFFCLLLNRKDIAFEGYRAANEA
jgi:hypothetical protein